MIRAPLLAAPILAGFLLAPSAPALAASDTDKRTISLSGTGVAKARPDTAHISTGVVSEAVSAREALDKSNGTMSRVVTELKAQGLDPKDIQTTDFSVQPRYRRFKDGKPPEIIGYRVVNSVLVKVRQLERLGEILDKVVTLGANRIGGIAFSVDDPAALQDAARKRAVQNAIRKARLYAEAAGAKLGKVMKISEGASHRPPRPVLARAALRSDAAAAPIEPGEATLQVRVDVTWELE